jgi:hypothetical protein
MYQLRWEGDVSRLLLEAVASLKPPETELILSALADVELMLADRPDLVGESREPGTRFLFHHPLGITYKVNARLREALVTGARIHFGKNKK